MTNFTFGWTDLIGIFGLLISLWIAYTAYSGLSSWKKQTSWKARNEIAVRILTKCYQIEEAFKLVRKEEIKPEEIKSAMYTIGESDIDIDHPDYNFESVKAVFRQRGKVMNKAFDDINEVVISAKVYWPDLSVSSKLSELIQLANSLHEDVDLYVTNLKYDQYPVYDPNDPADREKVKKDVVRRMKLQKSVFQTSDEDEFRTKIKLITDQLNKVLAEYM